MADQSSRVLMRGITNKCEQPTEANEVSQDLVEIVMVSIHNNQVQGLVCVPQQLSELPAWSAAGTWRVKCRGREMKYKPSGVPLRPSVQLLDGALQLIHPRVRKPYQSLEVSTPGMAPPLPSMSAIVCLEVSGIEVLSVGRSLERTLWE